MTDKIDRELITQLAETLSKGVTDEAVTALKKKVEEITCYIEDDIMWRLKDDLAHNLAAHAADMAQRAVEMLLEGNEDQMRRYLSCDKRGPDGEYIGWTGRSDSRVWGNPRRDEDWHPVIHGQLFEQGAVALRKKIVDAHRDLLVNERILDMEDQIKSLVAQNVKLTKELEELRQRVRDAA